VTVPPPWSSPGRRRPARRRGGRADLRERPAREVNSIIWPNDEFDRDITVYGSEVKSLAARYLTQMLSELAPSQILMIREEPCSRPSS